MAYPKRDWANTGNEVTKEDFKRIENGIEANDIEITKQKNPTIPGTLAKQIADNVTAIEENANKINDCSPKNQPIFTSTRDNIGGGEISLEAPKSSSAIIKNKVRMDVFNNKIRIFEDGNGYKGAHINISNCGAVDSTEIATTTKTSFLCTAGVGYTIVWQDCYVQNGIKHVNLRIKKTDDTVFNITQHIIFTVPFSTTSRIPLEITPYKNTALTSIGTSSQNGLLWTPNAYLFPKEATSYGFEIKCTFE